MHKKGIESKPHTSLHVKGASAQYEKKNHFFINNYITSSKINQPSSSISKDTNTNVISKKNFHFLFVIGRGGFGKVWKVEEIKSRKNFALKEMSKSK